MTKQNVSYADSQKAGIAKLVSKSTYDKATAHVTFDPASVTVPEGITEDSMRKHLHAINDITGQVSSAMGEITRREHGENKKVERADGTLVYGGFTINSDHDLRQKIGDDHIYGTSVTAVVHDYTAEQSAWLEENQAHNASLAKGLFD